MLRNLREYEAPRIDRALGSGSGVPLPPGLLPALRRLDYLFHGTAPEAPALFVAGGVLGNGRPVSGAGRDPSQALTRLLGEAAELLSLDASAPGTSSEGLGAGPDPESAAFHGLLELLERDAAARWWTGRSIALRWPDADAQDAVAAALGLPRTRPAMLWSLPTHGAATTVFAASFDPGQETGFCFGVAARTGRADAAAAALRELGLSEFGLVMARARKAPSDTPALRAALLSPADMPASTGTGAVPAGSDAARSDYRGLAASLPTDLVPEVTPLEPLPPFFVVRVGCPGLLPGALVRTTVHTATTLTAPVEVALF